jgi:PTS system ascorbate-specific IIC component
MTILNVIATQVLGDPTIVLGLVALIGLILLKKSKQDLLLGTIKVMLGYIILSAGAGFITGALDPLTKMIRAGNIFPCLIK